jgi:LacI family transcriptional regulator
MKRPTQSDVAKAAGVSRATVSYVLNDREGKAAISSETRQRVLEVMEAFGYEPDTRAQSLRSGGSKTIGLLIPDIHNPHFWQAVEGVEEEARKAGYDLILAQSSADQSREDYCLQALSRRTISGLIVIKTMAALSVQTLEKLLVSNHAIVECSDAPSPFDCVQADYRQGMGEIMRHLFALGHRHFAFIHGVTGPGVGADRLEVYLAMLQEAGMVGQVETCGISIEDGYQAALRLFSKTPYPTALVVINDLLAMGVLRAAHDLALRVPQDISVASFDDLPISAYLVPRLTTVRRDFKVEARLATELLLERLRHPKRPRQRCSGAATELIVRESTGKPKSYKEWNHGDQTYPSSP